MATQKDVEMYATAARGYVSRALGLELDGSETSLAFVDHYIQKSGGAALKDDLLALVAPALGAYFGEVVIAKLGGAWALDGEDPARWRVELEPVELRFYPVGMAAAALRGGEVDGYDDSFGTRPELMARLSEALAMSPVVEADYFYSLTGRLETLTHVTELLVEIERRLRGRD